MEKQLIEARATEFEKIFSEIRQQRGLNFAKISGLKNSERHFLWLLFSLSKTQKNVKPSELAKKLGVTMAAVSHQIQALEELGFVERINSLQDRREVSLKITETGKDKIATIKKYYWEKICGLIEYLGEEDSRKLTEIFAKIAQYLPKD